MGYFKFYYVLLNVKKVVEKALQIFCATNECDNDYKNDVSY